MSRLFLDDPPPFLVEDRIDEVEKDRKEVDACETARGKMDSIAEEGRGVRRGREGRAAVEVELAREAEKRDPRLGASPQDLSFAGLCSVVWSHLRDTHCFEKWGS